MVSCNVSCGARLVSVFLRDVEFSSDGDLQTVRQIKKYKCPKPVLIVQIHGYFNINAVHLLQNTKNIFWVHIRVLWSSFSLHWKPNILFWQLMTASNVGAWTQAWQAKWAVFKIPGFVYKRFLPFFPTPSPLFYLYHFSRGLWLSFLVLCSLRSKRFHAFPPTFIFWLLFHFSRGQNRESRSSAFLYSETKRKCLLRRLPYMLPDYCHLWLGLTGRFVFHTVWRQIERC